MIDFKSVKFWIALASAGIILGAGTVGWIWWSNHQREFEQRAKDRDEALNDLGKSQADVLRLENINRSNSQALALAEEARHQMENEAGRARAEAAMWQSRWRTARDAIINAPPSDVRPPSGVFCRTVDSLWDGPEACPDHS